MWYAVEYNNKTLDASLQPQVGMTTVKNAINFTSALNTSYDVMSTSVRGRFDGYRKYADQFSINLYGLVPTYITSKMAPVLTSSWKSKLSSKALIHLLHLI